MAKDTQDVARELFSRAIENFSNKPTLGKGRHGGLNLIEGMLGGGSKSGRGSSNPLDGVRGVAAGAGAAALIPAAVKLIRGGAGDRLASAPGDAASRLGGALGEKVTSKVDEAGGPSGIAKEAVKNALPFGGSGGGGGSKGGAPGVGKGRRMPVQQSVDIGVPLETVYNQWTQFEDWPNFMHRVTRVSQQDETTITFATKIWGKTKEFTATVETQRPNERIKWKVSQGLTHQGVVTFHELAPNLTRVLLNMDVEPGGLLEKAARGMRHVKRAARADLHRFKAFIEMNEHETGAWRGVIEDGEVVEDHDPSYDEDREYIDVEEATGQSDADSGDEDEQEDSESQDEEQPEAREQEDDEGEEEETPRSPRRSRARSSNGNGSDSQSEESGRGRSRSRSSSGTRTSSGTRSSGGSRSSSSRRQSNGQHSGRSRSRSSNRQSS
jgi:uncharacterized membrane protein YgcG